MVRGDHRRVRAPRGSPACPQPPWLRLSHVRLQLRSSLHRGMQPQPEPKAFPGSCPRAPTESGEVRGWGRRCHQQLFQGGNRMMPTLWHIHVLQGTPQHRQYTLNKRPMCPIPCLAPLGAHSTAQCGCSPGTPQLSPAAAKRVLTHGGGPGAAPGAAGHKWGQLGNAPGKPGLSAALGEPAAPTRGVPVCHHGQEQGDIQTCQSLLGCHSPQTV